MVSLFALERDRGNFPRLLRRSNQNFQLVADNGLLCCGLCVCCEGRVETNCRLKEEIPLFYMHPLMGQHQGKFRSRPFERVGRQKNAVSKCPGRQNLFGDSYPAAERIIDLPAPFPEEGRSPEADAEPKKKDPRSEEIQHTRKRTGCSPGASSLDLSHATERLLLPGVSAWTLCPGPWELMARSEGFRRRVWLFRCRRWPPRRGIRKAQANTEAHAILRTPGCRTRRSFNRRKTIVASTRDRRAASRSKAILFLPSVQGFSSLQCGRQVSGVLPVSAKLCQSCRPSAPPSNPRRTNRQCTSPLALLPSVESEQPCREGLFAQSYG